MKENKAVVEELLKKLDSMGVQYDKNVKINLSKVYDTNKEQMIRNILAVLNVGISEGKIKELC